MPLVAVNDVELYYEARGSGAPLVLLGGLGLDVSEMGMLTGPLAGRFHVIAVDNRGAGRSAKPPGPYSIEQMAADVVGLMDRLELPHAHLLGISMGGRIAMALALAWPGRVDRLVLAATSPRAAGARRLVRAGMLVPAFPCCAAVAASRATRCRRSSTPPPGLTAPDGSARSARPSSSCTASPTTSLRWPWPSKCTPLSQDPGSS